MKSKFVHLVVLVTALMLLACSGLPGKFFGVGSLPSLSTDPGAADATFRLWLVAQDKEPDLDNAADTFRGDLVYTDEAEGIDIRGSVVDTREEGINPPEFADSEMGGVYPDFGAFAGYWTMQSPSDFPLNEGIFVVYVRDNRESGDEIRVELFDYGADILNDIPLYANEQFLNGGDIRYIPTKIKEG